jgi:alpha-L-fucosidase
LKEYGLVQIFSAGRLLYQMKISNDKSGINLKGVGGRYNSFQNKPELIPLVDRSIVKSTEAFIEPEIMAYPFQTETSIADWHYRTGMKYLDAKTIIRLLMQNISRNGTMLLNITQHGRGDLDSEVVHICKDVGA